MYSVGDKNDLDRSITYILCRLLIYVARLKEMCKKYSHGLLKTDNAGT